VVRLAREQRVHIEGALWQRPGTVPDEEHVLEIRQLGAYGGNLALVER